MNQIFISIASGIGEGFDKAANFAVVDVSGAGSIVVNVAKTLRATISGAGSVEYYGDPEVRQSVSGVGRVKRRQSAAADGPAVARGAASLHSDV